MKILQKLGVVVGTVLVSVIVARLILQLIFTHNQGFFSFENFLYALTLPIILVFWERNATITSLIWKSAGFALLFTLSDYLLVSYGDWPGMIW